MIPMDWYSTPSYFVRHKLAPFVCRSASRQFMEIKVVKKQEPKNAKEFTEYQLDADSSSQG